MSRFLIWLRLSGPAQKVNRSVKTPRPALRSRPTFDVLEDRRVPANISVNSLLDNLTSGDGQVTLREAFAAIQNNTTTDLGQTGTGNDTIVFANGLSGDLNLTMAPVTNDSFYGNACLAVLAGKSITIDGTTSATGINIVASFTANLTAKRVFNVAGGGTLTLNSVEVSGGVAQGGKGGDTDQNGGGGGGGAGLGGAIFNVGTLNIQNCLFMNNLAQGGAGGAVSGGNGLSVGNGGGGGGLSTAGGGAAALSNAGGAGGGPNGGTGGNHSSFPTAGGLGGGGGGGEGHDTTFNQDMGESGAAGGFGAGGGGAGKGGSGTGPQSSTGGNAGFGGGGGGGATGGSGGISGGWAGGAGANSGGGGAGMGGAIFNNGGTVTISSTTFTANTASGGLGGTTSGTAGSRGAGFGGAIYNRDGDVTIRSSTLFNNTADTGDVFNLLHTDHSKFDPTTKNTANLTINNSIVVSSAIATSVDSLVASGSSSSLANIGAGNLFRGVGASVTGFFFTATTNPQLGPLGKLLGKTMAYIPLTGSPAINGGINSGSTGVVTDQRGLPRFSGNIDIGAVETQPLNLVVDTTNDTDDGDYTAGHLSIAEAVKLANQNAGPDTISFAGGLGAISTTAQLTLSDTSGATTITGPISATQTVGRSIAGNTANFRVFQVAAGASAVFNDLTITNGLTANSGSGVQNLGTLTMSYCTVSGNVINANVNGGGIQTGANSVLNISHSTISGNSTLGAGGGISLASTATVALSNCTISGNTAAQSGGGILVNQGTITIVNCTITLNGSDSGNTSSGNGGGIDIVSPGSATLSNTIVAGNFKHGANITDSPIVGSDIAGTAAAASSFNLISEPASAGGLTNGVNGNLVGDGSGGQRDITTVLDIGLIPGPSFQQDATHGLKSNGGPTLTHALVENSPAIGAGSTTVPGYSPYDQRDAARDPVTMELADIGAFEAEHPLAPVGAPSTYAATFQPTPSASANEAFVKGLYQSTVLRAADPAGLQGWVNALNGGASKASVAYGFVNSTENRINEVTAYYKYFLGRTPDPAGLTGWVNLLQSGVDEGTVMSGFLLSPEFTAQTDNAGFVNLMYYAILGRQSDPTGYAGWVAQLNSGVPRDQVGNGFLRSTESLTRVVIADFGSYLKRVIDSAAASPYVSQVAAGTTFGRVAASILGSDEFFAAAGQNLT